jgi:hypothetical protein
MTQPDTLPRWGDTVRDLQGLLRDEHAEILDIRRGLAPGTRRLLVGRRGDPHPSHVVSVATVAESAAAVDREGRNLQEIRQIARPTLRDTLPAIIEPIESSGLAGLVLTAVPGLLVSTPRPAHRSPGPDAVATLDWLQCLWQDTASIHAGTTVGLAAADDLVARYAGATDFAGTLGAVHRARTRLAAFVVPRTVGHGCLCPEHVFASGGVVTGVDDWSGSEIQADPLRDLGGWVVRSVGSALADVITVRNTLARTMRDFLMEGLRTWDIPATRWRDLILLTQAEIAVEGLRHGDAAAMDLLTKISRVLPRERNPDGRHA